MLVTRVPCEQIGELAAPADLKETLTELQSLSKTGPAHLADALRLYRTRCLLLLGDADGAERLINEGIEAQIDTPELLELRRWVAFARKGFDVDPQEFSQYRVDCGQLLPLTRWGRSHSARLTREGLDPSRPSRVHMVDPPAPDIPFPETYYMAPIAELMEEMGVWREASDVWIETAYNVLTPDDWYREGAKFWLRVARIEQSLGESALAVRAYLRVAHYDHSLREEAETGLRACLAEKPLKGDVAPLKLDARKLERIADLYCKQNMHPVAMQLLRRAGEQIDVDFTDRIEAISAEWRKVLNARVQRGVYGPDAVYYSYGQTIAKDIDWLAVRFARPSDSFWKPSKAAEEAPPTEESADAE